MTKIIDKPNVPLFRFFEKTIFLFQGAHKHSISGSDVPLVMFCSFCQIALLQKKSIAPAEESKEIAFHKIDDQNVLNVKV